MSPVGWLLRDWIKYLHTFDCRGQGRRIRKLHCEGEMSESVGGRHGIDAGTYEMPDDRSNGKWITLSVAIRQRLEISRGAVASIFGKGSGVENSQAEWKKE